MSTNKTPNYQLNQWVKTDQVLMDEFNADNAKVDAALDGLSGQVATKASQSALNSLTSTVNTKASQSSLDALDTRVTNLTSTVNTKASQSALNTVKNQVAKLGNCQVGYFTYKGTGTEGPEGPTRVNFPKKPAFFIIVSGRYFGFGGCFRESLTLDLSSSNSTAVATWTGNQLSFYATSAANQLNTAGYTYYVLALYAQDQ